VDRAAEPAWIAESGVVDQDDQDVRRPVGRVYMSDQVPVRLRATQRLIGDTSKRRPPDRQLGAVNGLVAHVALPPIVVRSPSRLSASRLANARAPSVKSGLRLVGGILIPNERSRISPLPK